MLALFRTKHCYTKTEWKISTFSLKLVTNLFSWKIEGIHVIGKIKWVLTKYETWFDFFLALFVSEYKGKKQDLERLSFNFNVGVLFRVRFEVGGWN